MPGFDQLFQTSSNVAALPVWLAGGLAALAVFAGVVAFTRVAQAGRAGLAWRATLVLATAGFAWVVATVSIGRDQTAAGRILEARAHDLTMRALAPGSPLGCLESLDNPKVEEACEKALFGSAETVAAAVAYVDARISILAKGIELSSHDGSISESADRWRRPIENDRFGLVAHVLRTRGCSADRCDELKLLRDPQRVIVNLRERIFEAQVVLHSAAWQGGGRTQPAPQSPVPVAAAPPAVAEGPVASTTGTAAAAIDYPTAASIPAISIMDAEPPLSKAEAQALAAPPVAPKPAAAAPPQPAQPRRQPARQGAPSPLPPPGTQPEQQQQAPAQAAPPAASNIPRWGGGN